MVSVQCQAFIFVHFLLACGYVVATDGERESLSSGGGGTLSTMWRMYEDCQDKNFGLVNCLKAKAVTMLDRVSRSEVITLDGSISIVKEGATSRADYGRSLDENELESSLVNENENSIGGKLNNMLLEKFESFVNSHVIKIGLPQIDAKTLMRDLGEGRGKMKKTMGMFMMAAMMKAMMLIPMSIGTLFILAGKALIISKIALVLSLLITLKKLIKPHEHVVHEAHGFSSGGGGQGWDRRSSVQATAAAAQNMAYNSYANQYNQ